MIGGRRSCSVADGAAIPTRSAAPVSGRRFTTRATRALRVSTWRASCSTPGLTRMRTSRTSTGRCRRCSALPESGEDPQLTSLLLEFGADPNGEPQFGDAIYHSVEAEDTRCLRVLLEHGANPRGSWALAHALDYERREHVRLLLDAGADANEGALLVHAVRRGRGLDYIRCWSTTVPTWNAAVVSGRRRRSYTGPLTRMRSCGAAAMSRSCSPSLAPPLS
jgi:ankyrin repeat protein